MKKRNPIRDTVTCVVQSTGGRRNKNKNQTPKTKFIEFFEDLENRGPFHPDSLFEKWTKKIHRDMKKKGLWVVESEDDIFEFVAEYINRLQKIYHSSTHDSYHIHKIVRGRQQCGQFTPEGYVFRIIYLKIRVWGLRAKMFRLRRWLKGSMWVRIHYETVIFPPCFTEKFNKGEEVFRYVISFYHYNKGVTKEIYKEKTLKK